MPVASFTLAAAVVDVNGKVKATQTSAQSERATAGVREIPIRITIVTRPIGLCSA